MKDTKQEAGDFTDDRQRMVSEQLRRRGLNDQRVIDALLHVPREWFIPHDVQALAYDDRALSVGHGQTISQPYIVAYMTQLLELTPTCRVLEIGTGTGYQAAILARLAGHVYSVERIAALQEQAKATLSKLNVLNVTLTGGDGSVGLPEHAPYDRIIATAAAPRIPPPLIDQLVDGGRLVIPVGGTEEQTIVSVARKGRRTVETPTLACRFVKLIGEEGWRKGP